MRYEVKQERVLLSADDGHDGMVDDCHVRYATEADLLAACEAAGLTCRAPSVAPAEALQRVVDAWKPIVRAAVRFSTQASEDEMEIISAINACPGELLP